MSDCNLNEQNIIIGTDGVCTNLEGKTRALYLVKDDFKATLNEITTKQGWKDLVKAKKIIPLYEIYELANANKEATYFETGNFKYETGKAVKGVNAELYLSICAHRALKSYENSEYKRIIEVTERNEIVALKRYEDSDGEIATGFSDPYYTGQSLKSFFVGIRNSATKDKSPFTPLQITYSDFEELENYGIILKPASGFDVVTDVDGIVNINLESYVNDEGDFVIKTKKSCTSNGLLGLTSSNLILKNSSGVTQSILLVSVGDGVYTVALTSGVAFPNGYYTIETNGVIEIDGIMYEILPTQLFTSFN